MLFDRSYSVILIFELVIIWMIMIIGRMFCQFRFKKKKICIPYKKNFFFFTRGGVNPATEHRMIRYAVYIRVHK